MSRAVKAGFFVSGDVSKQMHAAASSQVVLRPCKVEIVLKRSALSALLDECLTQLLTELHAANNLRLYMPGCWVPKAAWQLNLTLGWMSGQSKK